MKLFSPLQIICATSPPPQKYLLQQLDRFISSKSSLFFFWYLYIIQYVGGKVFLPNSLKQHLPDKVSLVISLSVTSYLINGILIKVYDVSLTRTFIYLLLDIYSSHNQRHKIIISIFKFSSLIFCSPYILLYGLLVELFQGFHYS